MAFLISDLALGKPDMRGDIVQEIYAIGSQTFAIYRAANRVRVMFADDAAEARRQRDIFAPIETLRGEIAALMEGWMDEGSAQAARQASYCRRLADALGLAFRELPDAAKAALDTVKTDLTRERVSIGRREYMGMAAAVAAGWVVIAAVLALVFLGWPSARFGWTLVFIIGSGCFGALFSIALNLSARQIQPDLLRRENLLDASLRISIAAMSAILLYALLSTGLVTLSLQGVSLKPEYGFGFITFLSCVLAGFSERLVGNFLASAAVAANGTARSPETLAQAAKGAAEAHDRAMEAVAQPGAQPAPVPAADEAAHDEDGHVDGCTCDHPDPDAGADDVELPPARGGVAA